MTVWPVKTLGEVCEVARGTSITRKETKEGMIPVIAGGIDVAYFHSVQNRPAGTITVSSSGANAGFVNRWDVPIFASDCSTVVAKEGGMVFGDYAFRFLQFKQSFINAELRRGAAQPHVYAKDIAAIEIPVPPLEEQKRIVALLDAATARVAELAACYEQARTHANNLFTSALRDALESNPDWPVKTLGEICQIEMGRTPSRGDSKGWDKEMKTSNHWASIADLTACRGRVLSSTKERISDFAAKTTKVVPTGTLVMSFKLSIGKLAFAGCDLYTNEAIAAFHLPKKSEVDSAFLYWALMVVDWASLTMGSEKVKGATMNKAKLNVLEISVPPLAEQKRIVERLDSMRAKTSEMVGAYDAKLQAAKDLRQSLLEAAFAGDL